MSAVDNEESGCEVSAAWGRFSGGLDETFL